MKRMTLVAGGLGILLVLGTAGRAAAQTDAGWKLKLNGVSAHSLNGWSMDGSAGVGLGLEYRASRRIGVELGILTSEVEDEVGFDFFGLDLLVFESTLRMTPVLARLNVHLTPGRRADLYLGPVAGWLHYGDLEIRLASDFLGGESVLLDRVGTKDGFGWGGHIGVDVPLGDRGLFFTAGATLLSAEVELDEPSDEAGGDSFDLDPLVAQVGFGYRF